MADIATSPTATRPDSWDSATPVDQADAPIDSREDAAKNGEEKTVEEERPTMQIHHDRRESNASTRPDVDAPPAK